MSPEDKEQFDGCMKMVEVHNSRRRDREGFEWKLSIAFWTLVSLTIAFALEHSFLYIPCWIRGSAALAGLFIYWIFAQGLAGAHSYDRERGRRYQEMAAAILGDKAEPYRIGQKPIRKWWHWKRWLSWVLPTEAWGQWFQWLTTAFLLGALFYFSGSAHVHWNGIWSH